MQTVLTIAGFDPSTGAGVTADLMVFAAHGLYGTACITALTVQSTLGVRTTHATPPEVVEATLACLNVDIPPAGIKIGMLANEDNSFRVSEYLSQLQLTHSINSKAARIPIVLDPVLRSTSGRELIDAPGFSALKDRLLPLVDWVTPNLDELAALTGETIAGRDDLPRACQALQNTIDRKPGSQRVGVFATGGHLEHPDDFLLLPSGEGLWLPGERIATRATHGTGCALSSAFLSRLILGDPPREAAAAAKLYVTGALRTAVKVGTGHGPMNHLWPLLRATD
ncbi:MAG: bifunctional hydroxymethylpyrimidine kinase/phosphomethylpyrimidine kinase [Acidobacteriaceae bacterium]|jgi:hydroxymethylpyrimidine/phosphomethylpyrimidine kinase